MHLHPAKLTLVVALASLLAVGCSKKRDAKDAQPAAVKPVRPTLGAVAPKVEVLAFLGYQDTFVRANAETLMKVVKANDKVLRLRVYDLPLEVHDQSVLLAKAAVAAFDQGKWQTYYDAILQMDKIDRDALLKWAANVGLDAKKFAAALDDKGVDERIAADVALAAALGVTGTPSYIVNGALVQGAQSEADWAKIIAGQVAGFDMLKKGVAGEGKDGKDAKKPGKTPEKAPTDAEVLWQLAQKNSPQRAPLYKKHVLDGVPAPASPVPAKVQRKSGVVSAKIMPAGGAMGGGVQVGQPVRIGEEAGDPNTVWRVAVRPDDPTIGAATALVTMVLFEDFECPFCKQLQGAIKEAREKVGPDKLRVIYKHNPLPFHKQAMAAAEAAEAARAQGKFWELHDQLFANQDKLALGVRALAEKAGLDMGQFDNAIAAHGSQGRIMADMEQAAALGARGTPNIFINGKKLVGAKDAATLLTAINVALAEANAAIEGGKVKAEGYYESVVGKGKLLDSLASETVELDTKGAATRGPAGAAIHIVTFQDFQCPFCARLDPHIAVMEAEFPGRVKVTWMDFPLRKIHPEAEIAAQAGKEALAQGKFWEFHKAVMADQSDLTPPGLTKLAKTAGLDVKKLDKNMKAGKWAAAVQQQRAIAEKLDIKGTPTVYINGHKFTPQLGFSANTFRGAIRRILGTRN